MSSKLIILAATIAIANCALLGHISYASDPLNQQISSGFNGGYYGRPFYNNHQQQVAYQQIPPYAQYAQYAQFPSSVLQSNYIQSPAYVSATPVPFGHAVYGAPFNQQQNVQFQSPQLNSFGINQQQQQQQSFNGFNGYLLNAQQFAPVQQNSLGQGQPPQFPGVQQQSVPVQNYQSVQVQPLQQTVTPNNTPSPTISPPRITTVQNFPALPVNNNNNVVVQQPKNAHHYPATITRPGAVTGQQQTQQQQQQQFQQPQQQQQQQRFQQNSIGGSTRGSNSVFRTSFSSIAPPSPQPTPQQQFAPQNVAQVAQPPQTIRSAATFPTAAPTAVSSVSPFATGPRIIQSGPYFTQTIFPAVGGQTRLQPVPSSAPFAANPINIPSQSLVAPNTQQQQQQQSGRTQVPFQQQQQQQSGRNQFPFQQQQSGRAQAPFQRQQQPQPVQQQQRTPLQPVPVQQFQPQNKQAKYSPSTAVSHTRFSGMGIHYEW